MSLLMLAFFAKVSTWQSEEPTTQLVEIQDTQHAFSLVSRTVLLHLS